MEELSIKIKIADREYPMKVKRADEERVRIAGKLINEKLKTYRQDDSRRNTSGNRPDGV
jgi:cell division protein ZapA